MPILRDAAAKQGVEYPNQSQGVKEIWSKIRTLTLYIHSTGRRGSSETAFGRRRVYPHNRGFGAGMNGLSHQNFGEDAKGAQAGLPT